MSELEAEVETEAAETTEAPAETEPKTTEAATTEPVQFSYADYVKTHIQDEKLRDYGSRFKSVEDQLKNGMELRKEVAQRIKPPGKDATPEDIAAYRKAIGAGQKEEDYVAPLPEGAELTDTDEAMLAEFRKIALEGNMRKEDFAKASAKYIETQKKIIDEMSKSVEEQRKEAHAALEKKWGNDLKASFSAGKELVHKLNVPGAAEMIETATIVVAPGVYTKMGDYPPFVEFLATIGKRAGGDSALGVTPAERETIQEQINKLRADHPFGTPAYTKDVDRKLNELYAKLS